MFIQLMQAFAMVCSPLMCVSLPFRHLRYHKRFSVSSFTAADSFTLKKNATHTRSTITHSRCGKLKKIHEMCLCVWRFDTLRRQRWTYENSDFFYTAPDVSRTCSSSASCTAFQIESCFFLSVSSSIFFFIFHDCTHSLFLCRVSGQLFIAHGRCIDQRIDDLYHSYIVWMLKFRRSNTHTFEALYAALIYLIRFEA